MEAVRWADHLQRLTHRFIDVLDCSCRRPPSHRTSTAKTFVRSGSNRDYTAANKPNDSPPTRSPHAHHRPCEPAGYPSQSPSRSGVWEPRFARPNSGTTPRSSLAFDPTEPAPRSRTSRLKRHPILTAIRDMIDQAFPLGTIAMIAVHRRVGSGFIEKYQVLQIDIRQLVKP